MQRVVRLLLLTLVMVVGGAFEGHATKRIALVIGNNAYEHLPATEQLKSAINDAKAVRKALESLDFKVLYGENVSREAFIDKFFDFTSRISAGDTALFYYAGHGVGIKGGNYLLPSDIRPPQSTRRQEEQRVIAKSVGELYVLSGMKSAGAQVAIAVLDACRNNPLAAPNGRSLGATRGFGRISPPTGVFSIYSAGFSQTALDRLPHEVGDVNSVFTRVFVKNVVKPGFNLYELARATRRDVVALAGTIGHEQIPAIYDQVVGDPVYLAGRNTAIPSETKSPAAFDPAKQAWETIEDTKRAGDLEAFIKRFPDSFYTDLARSRLKELKKPVAPKPVGVLSKPVMPAKPPSVLKPVVGTFPDKPESADEFQDCAECPKMVVVPAGNFMMGSPANERSRDHDEGPQHRVTISHPFAVGKFEVTFSEWDACVAGGGCSDKPGDEGWGRGRRPVINVSWDDAKAYVSWLSGKTGEAYRLLSEAEWEYAARAGTTTPFSTGRTITTAQANFDGNYTYNGSRQGRYRQETVTVGSFSANRFGLYDMHGNVWEWVEDCWNENYRGAPNDGSYRISGNCSLRVLRGGAWSIAPWGLRSAIRLRGITGHRLNFSGFRVARTLTP